MPLLEPMLIAALVLAVLAVLVVVRAVRIVPQARARNVERLGRYHRTLQPGLNFVIPFVDRVYPAIDLREQVVSFAPQPVITEDNLVVEIDTVLYFQVTDPRSAAYEIASYLQAVEHLTVTTLRNVVGSMDLEKTLTSRDSINNQLRGVLDDATGRWGLRVNRVEIKAIDPPQSIKDAMEKQMRAERDKRAAILSAEGHRQSQILTAEGDKQGAILRAEGNRTAAILQAEGEARTIDQVFSAVHRNDPDPKLLAYQYLQVLPSSLRARATRSGSSPARSPPRCRASRRPSPSTCRPPPQLFPPLTSQRHGPPKMPPAPTKRLPRRSLTPRFRPAHRWGTGCRAHFPARPADGAPAMAVLAVAIFVVTYALIATERIDRVAAALGGAAALVVVGIVDAETAFFSPDAGVDWNVIFLLLGMMIIVGVFKQTGLFEYLAIWAAQRSGGHPYRLMVLLAGTTALASALLDNVTTVLSSPR